jgi:hypothetical protein
MTSPNCSNLFPSPVVDAAGWRRRPFVRDAPQPDAFQRASAEL